MARTMTFSFEGRPFECSINKVDRGKLYGRVSVETLDVEKRRCELATLAYDGKTIIPFGGTALGYMNPDGHWLTRSQLTPTTPDGELIEEVESSFKITNELNQIATPEEFLDHSTRLTYQLDEEKIDSACRKALDSGTIFKIRFSYRGGVSVDPAFVLSNEEGVWLLITDINLVEYANLSQAAVCSRLDEPEETKEDAEELDFGML